MPFNLAEYEPVEDRIRAFWEDHPSGRIITELVYTGTDGYIVKASVFREQYLNNGDWNDFPSGTGLAQEAVTERGVNATSALENCETSAIGRALANLGYAAKGKRPSREEMVKASGGSPSSASSPEKRSSQREAPPEPTSTKAPLLFCRRRECGHESALHPLGLACEGINGSHNDPEGGEYPCRCKGFVGDTSGTGAGEAGTAPEGYGEGPDGAVPSTTELATAEDLANAAKHGLTPTKTKAIAASLGITVAKATDLTREQLAAVINRYLEVKK